MAKYCTSCQYRHQGVCVECQLVPKSENAEYMAWSNKKQQLSHGTTEPRRQHNPCDFSFDEAPVLVYVQKEGRGIGELYLNGKRIKGLQKIAFEASTMTDEPFPKLKLEVYPKGLADSITKED